MQLSSGDGFGRPTPSLGRQALLLHMQVWEHSAVSQDMLRGIAGLEVPVQTEDYSVNCDLWDVFSSRRAGSLHVHVQTTGD